MKKQIVIAAILSSLAPAVAFAGPSFGIAYTDVGLSGHASRPGVMIGGGNITRSDILVSGDAAFARGFYGVNARMGKVIPVAGQRGNYAVLFIPYVDMGFVNMNWNQQKTGYTQQSIQDCYGLAGVDLNIPLGGGAALTIGGGGGHTLMTFGETGGAVYRGSANANFRIAKHVSAGLGVSYLHLPAAPALVSYDAGLSYHFS